MTIEQQIGAMIVSRRKQRRWSQERLAVRVGVSRHYLSEVEHGERQVSVAVVYRIAVALEMKMGEMFAECDVENP